MGKRFLITAALGAVIATAGTYAILHFSDAGLTDAELDTAHSLSLASLPPLPKDPSNAVADSPLAVTLGQALFNDTGFSSNGAVACATCHLSDKQFQDDLPLGHGVGFTGRRTMPLSGAAYASWLFWDGRKDSLWSQAIGPAESAVEHNFTRSQVAARISAHYRAPYIKLFGPLPDFTDIPAASPLGNAEQQAAWNGLGAKTQDDINRVFANFGKAIAAFERSLPPLENRFDRYVNAVLTGASQDGNASLTQQEIDGFKVFAGKGECTKCHNGPRLTDEFFHNTGIASPVDPVTDHGRAGAIAQVENDPFNCVGPYSDATPQDCGDLRFMSRDEHLFERAFKPPSLRGVANRAPYMHASQIDTLEQVIEHYNNAPQAPSGHTELEPLNLSAKEKAALLAFLKTL